MENELKIKHACNYMKMVHKDDHTGHDIAHVERVHTLAKYIALNEGLVHTTIIELAALLHDTVDSKITNEQQAYDKLSTFLETIDLTQDDIQHVLHIIQNMSYRGGKNNQATLSIEGQIVRDADRLDALGAIGIARTFQFAGYFGEPMWTESKLPKNFNDDTLSTLSPSAIKHFYEKLFKLKDLMHTNTAKQIAIQRHDFMEHFVSQFLSEWHQL